MDAFTISSWPVDSRVTLCRVAWDSNYRDVVRFEDEKERDVYFDSLQSDSIVISEMTYLKINEPIRINIPFNACYNYNYLIVENPELPVPGETTPPKLYYFISSVAFDAPNTSIINVQLDVFQTYLFDFELGQCFLERGHWPMSEFNRLVTFDSDNNPMFSWDDARRYLTAPEGLDIGNEYTIAWANHYDLTNGLFDKNNKFIDGSDGWAVLVMSTTSLIPAWGDENSPNLKTAKGSSIDGLISGCEIILFWEVDAFKDFMHEVSDAPWVSSGILCITAVPRIILYEAYSQGYFSKIGYNGKSSVENVYTVPKTLDRDFSMYNTSYDFKRSYYYGLPEKVRHFYKLYTFPYAVIELSALNGCTLLLKPELMNTDNIQLNSESCVVPGNIRLALYVAKYGTNKNFDDTEYQFVDFEYRKTHIYDKGYGIDVALWFDNFPQFAITNDNYLMYLAGTTHTRQYQYQAAGWAQSRANMQNEQNFKNVNAQLATQAQNQQINLNNQVTQTLLQGASDVLSMNLGGLISPFKSYFNASNENEMFQNTLGTNTQIANDNYFLANNIIQGDYENTIAGINATVQDAALTQPSVSGANGGDAFNISNGLFGYDIRYKTPVKRYQYILAAYWGRYGYAYHQYVKPPKNLKCMKYFTYWKLKDSYITTAKADETSKNVIRAIFERGVTVWNKADEIGTIDPMDNWELYGD